MFGIFGKKENKAPKAASPAPVMGRSGIPVDPTFLQVCNLLNYQTTTEMRQLTYGFVSKNFCCAICWDGVIYGGPSSASVSIVSFFFLTCVFP